jgi:hypothetical protein
VPETPVSKLNTVLLLVVIGLLAWGMVNKPQPESKPTQIGRFLPIPTSQVYALDTVTGKACAITPNQPHILTEKEQHDLGIVPVATVPVPLCSEMLGK